MRGLTSIVFQVVVFGLASAAPLITPAPSTTSAATSTAAASTTVYVGAPLWGQCGGMTWSGPRVCAEGHCVYINPYFSNCLPESPAGGPVPLGGQCGGQDYTGPTECAQGYCVYRSQWLSQCL
ncbi:hypothetical protein BKA70DRAFT_1291186 [Coprinopsis sp. MPI-PUGE-AT-0042]|nr:hypothetical protein BKA70DRAFT_1291186 [Coprinopsis sp. MPI-PUGE-AT-0042]